METIYFKEFIRRKKEGLPNSSLFKNPSGDIVPVVYFTKEVDIISNFIKERFKRRRINLEKSKLKPEEENALFSQAKRSERLFLYIAEYYSCIKNKREIPEIEKEYVYFLQEEAQEDALLFWQICEQRGIYQLWKPY